jgi:hypothetical protein
VFLNARYGSGPGSATLLLSVVAHLGELLLVGGVLADLEHALDLVLECEVERLLGEVSDDAGHVAAPEAPHALVPATSPTINNNNQLQGRRNFNIKRMYVWDMTNGAPGCKPEPRLRSGCPFLLLTASGTYILH